jgi:hypothetical protein
MDALTFIAEIVKACAWPIAAISIALIFRQQIRALLQRLKKGKLGSAEFEFEETVKALRDEAPRLPQQAQAGAPNVALATTNPRAAVLEAWLEVEAAADRLVRARNLPIPSTSGSPVATIRAIERAQLVDSVQVALFNDLRALRNQAVHDAEFTPSTESVLGYVRLANDLRDSFNRAANEG